jgi:hypothetical protein
VASAYHVRFRLDQVLRLFRGNVKVLYQEQPIRLPETRNMVDPVPRFHGDLTRNYGLMDKSVQELPTECAALTEDLEHFLQVNLVLPCIKIANVLLIRVLFHRGSAKSLILLMISLLSLW